jgi:predicted RNase H-like HicB family nuclease
MSKQRCTIDLYWSIEDDCWLASVRELYPCAARGDTRPEALCNLADAIEGRYDVLREMGKR